MIYNFKCPIKNCLESSNDETGGRLIERVNEYNGEDLNLHIIKHLIEAGHSTVTLDVFLVLSSVYHQNKFKRKVSKSVSIKHNKSSLNKHDTSVHLI